MTSQLKRVNDQKKTTGEVGMLKALAYSKGRTGERIAIKSEGEGKNACHKAKQEGKKKDKEP